MGHEELATILDGPLRDRSHLQLGALALLGVLQSAQAGQSVHRCLVLKSLTRPIDTGMLIFGEYAKWLVPLKGILDLWHGDEQDSLRCGEVAFVPAGTKYVRSPNGFTRLWVIHHRETGLSSQILTLDDDSVSVVGEPVAFPCPQDQVNSLLHSLCLDWPETIRPDTIRSLTIVVWQWLAWACGSAQATQALRGGSQMVSAALQVVNRRFRDPDYGVAQIAHDIGMHPSSLTRAVRQQTGLTVIEHLNQARILAAQRLLKDPQHSIEAVALASGFRNRSYFSRVFKQLTGINPGKFKRLGHIESDIDSQA